MRYDEFLHSGIKGMKWGIRRYQNDDGTYTPLGLERKRSERSGRRGLFRSRETSSDRPEMRRARSMSNEELRTATERMRLENAYRQALRDSSAGQSYAAQMMRDVGRNAVSSFAGGAANAVGQAVGKGVVDMFTGMGVGDVDNVGTTQGEIDRNLRRHY